MNIQGVAIVALGLFVGLYASFVGTTGGAAIMIFLLQYFHLINSVTAIAGTMLLVSSIPLGIFGLYDYYKRGDIDYYVGALISVGLIVGLIIGSRYAFIVNDTIGEKVGDKLKNGVTAAIYAVLAVMYTYLTFAEPESGTKSKSRSK
jgi:uncharacterized membrane protein YfcA